MSPGLPGTGVGGLFYILVALWMPACEALRRRQGDATGRGYLVAKQFAIAVGVSASMTGVFWSIDTMFMIGTVAAHVASLETTNWSIPLRVSALIATSCVLLLVLGSVQVARLILRLRRPQRAAG